MKKLLCLILALAMAFSLCACGGSKSSTTSADNAAAPEGGAAADDTVTISVWSGYPDQQEWFDWLVPAFEAENPNIKVELTSFPIADFETKVFAAIPAGTCADVITINPSYVYSFAGAGKFAEVPDELKELVKSGIYDEAVVKECSYDGEVVCVPHMLSNAAWFYNMQYFEDAGLVDANGEPILPTSMEEVIQTADKLAKRDASGKLTNSGISLRITGANSGTCEKWWVLLMQYGGTLLDEVSDGKYVAGYNNQAGFDTMRFYLRNLYEYGSDNYEVEHDTGAFIAGETAMFAREASVIVEAAKHPELRYGTFPMFNANIAITKSWYVLDNGSSAREEAAWKFIEFANSEESMVNFHHLGGYQPARKDLDVDTLVAGVDQREAFFKSFDKVYTYVAIDEFQEIMVKMADRLLGAYENQNLLTDDDALWKFLGEMADETNALLRENGHYGG